MNTEKLRNAGRIVCYAYTAMAIGYAIRERLGLHANKTVPIQLEMKDVNHDGLEDKVYTTNEGKQIQFAVPKDSTVTYLTYDQIENLKNVELQKYTIDTNLVKCDSTKSKN